jgi:hypothetical protein
MNANWKEARKDLKTLGIVVKTSIKSCCLGCVDESQQIDENVPALYQISKRFSSEDGGYLCHQNIGNTPLALQVMAVLDIHGIKWEWDGSEAHSIYVEMPLEPEYEAELKAMEERRLACSERLYA